MSNYNGNAIRWQKEDTTFWSIAALVLLICGVVVEFKTILHVWNVLLVPIFGLPNIGMWTLVTLRLFFSALRYTRPQKNEEKEKYTPKESAVVAGLEIAMWVIIYLLTNHAVAVNFM